MHIFQCRLCSERKPVGEFYRSLLNVMNMTGACKKCHIARMVQIRQAKRRLAWTKKVAKPA